MPGEKLPLDAPLGYPTSTFFLDESGVIAADRFTIAGLKLRRVGRFARDLKDIRDRYEFYGEFKFNDVTADSARFLYDVIDLLEESDALVVGCVVDPKVADPFAEVPHRWLAHVDVAAQLLIGCINRRELVCVLLDGITTPKGCALDDTIRGKVNRRFSNTSVVSAVCLNSETNDILQVADLIASSIAFERRRSAGGPQSAASLKGKVAARIAAAIGDPGLVDGRGKRFNIATYHGVSGRHRGKPVT